jgi:hypothetical protein
MSARTDLDNAIQYLEDGIAAHVAALASARDKSTDEAYINDLTVKINGLAEAVLRSTAAV